MNKFLEYLCYILLFLLMGILISCLVETTTAFRYNHRLSRFMRDNQYGVVIQAETSIRARKAKQGFTSRREYIVMLRGADTGEECPFRITEAQFYEIGLSDTISLDTLFFY